MGRGVFSKEFKQEAVSLVKQDGLSIAKASKDLGISWISLSNWIKQHEADHGERTDMLNSKELQELRDLRKENRRLKMEREILKKAAAFFAVHGN